MLDKTRESSQPLHARSADAIPAEAESARIRRRPSLDDTLRDAVRAAREAVMAQQQSDGHWCYELEADCTIPAEYIMMMHFMDEIDATLQAKLATYLRRRQNADGGWPLYIGGASDISCTVKAYYALKLAGDGPEAPHMAAARAAILQRGGAARANVFTRYALAMFGQVPWRAVPYVPIEIMLLPRWFPFHIGKVSYWSRTVMIPLSVLYTLKVRARNPRQIGVPELFTVPPDQERDYFRVRSRLNRILLIVERVARLCDPLIPGFVRRRALKRAKRWVLERLNGVDGLGAIFPAMVNAYETLAHLGYGPDNPQRARARLAIKKLVIDRGDYAYCQPCVSPVWDTGLAALAAQEADATGRGDARVRRALDWLAERQLLDAPGDWREQRPDLPGGGWPFQYGNGHYPDLDDTAVIAWAMFDHDPARYANAVERAAVWLAGMQCRDGGFAAFDVDNTHYYLNEIPFADHGALLDPPTADVTARVVTFLSRYDGRQYETVITRAMDFLRREQETDGSWFGRWGTNYIYGTWSVLVALEAAGISPDDAMVRRAVQWLKRTQRQDGGWGESNDSYDDPTRAGADAESYAFQTAWAVLGLMAADQTDSPEVRRGIDFLLRRQRPDGLWNDPVFTAPGFPRVFYLKYHGYDKIFPLWALARYERLCSLKTP